ncbi:MAG: hypothetical protein PHN78_07305 [Dehalococcoidales bacterium]|nr:hypothetical protein [Dehalococcoidales bacterium]
MAQKRTLILDEDALILVVDKAVVKQVDENRGEMTRTEFVNFLIHSQLKESSRSQNYVDKEELHHIVQELKELLRNFLDFFLTLELSNQAQNSGFEEWYQKIQMLDGLDSTN